MATKAHTAVLLAAALTWALPSLAAETGPTGDAGALFEAKCSVCHPSDRPKGKKKTRDEWEKTVTRMIQTNGASITPAEAKVIVEYLAKTHGP